MDGRDCDAVADPARGGARPHAPAGRRSVACQFLARGMGRRCESGGVRETAGCEDRKTLTGIQLGVEPARGDQHALARAMGVRPVLERRRWVPDDSVCRESQRAREVGAATTLLSTASVPDPTRTVCVGSRCARCRQCSSRRPRVSAVPAGVRLPVRNPRQRIRRSRRPHSSGRPRVGDQAERGTRARRESRGFRL